MMVKQLIGASGAGLVLAAVLMKPCIMINRIHEHWASLKYALLESFVLCTPRMVTFLSYTIEMVFRVEMDIKLQFRQEKQIPLM